MKLLCPWDSPGKNTGVGCHFVLQGIFLTQGLNPRLLRLLHCWVGSLPLVPPEKPLGERYMMPGWMSLMHGQCKTTWVLSVSSYSCIFTGSWIFVASWSLVYVQQYITLFIVAVLSPSCVLLFVTPWTVAHQAPLSMGFPRQEHWGGSPLPSPSALPNPGIKPGSLALADANLSPGLLIYLSNPNTLVM